MYQIAFEADQFPTLAPFLMMNRIGLIILLHPESGRPLDDHTINAAWMGRVLPLVTRILPAVDRITSPGGT
jgi:DOPA 4,5-dioxygenase